MSGLLWEEMLTAFDAAFAEPEEFFERGDQIAVVVRGRARPKGSSAELENRTGNLWTVRDGTVVSLRLFPKPEDALAAAGARRGTVRAQPSSCA